MFGLFSSYARRHYYAYRAEGIRIARARELGLHGFITLTGSQARPKRSGAHNATRVHIVSEDPVTFVSEMYLLRHLALHWREQGHVVTVGGPTRLPEADLAFLHLDATNTTAEAKAICARYPKVVNGAFTDNSKRTLSHRLVSRDSTYQGPVILKTDANYGGLPELRARFPQGIPEELIARNLHDPTLDWARVQHIPSANYFVLEHKAQIPDAVWSNPHLVVEQFTPEVDPDGLYCMRACFFLGSREAGLLVRSKEQIIKGPDVVARERIHDEAPAEVQAFKQQHQMEFGRIDYVVHKDAVIILDANKTASLSNEAATQFADIFVNPLAEELAAYV